MVWATTTPASLTPSSGTISTNWSTSIGALLDEYLWSSQSNCILWHQNVPFKVTRLKLSNEVWYSGYSPYFVLKIDEIFNFACPASPVYYQNDPVQTVKTCS